MRASRLSLANARFAALSRSYTVGESISQSPKEILHAGRKDQFRYFARFVAVLLGQYGEYLNRDKFDLLADGVGYRQAPIYATDEEFKDFAGKLAAVLMEAYSVRERVENGAG